MKHRPYSKPHRRSFLKSTTLAAIGATLAGPLPFRAAETPAARANRRIGFVDLDLENYHANVFLQALRGPLISRGFTVAGATGTKTVESRAWAEKNRVPFLKTMPT